MENKIYVVYEDYEPLSRKYLKVAFYDKEKAKEYCAEHNKLGIPQTWYDYEELIIKDSNNNSSDKIRGE